jgi:hypothetical protein
MCLPVCVSVCLSVLQMQHKLVEQSLIPMAVFDALRKFATFKLPDDQDDPKARQALVGRQRCVLLCQ